MYGITSMKYYIGMVYYEGDRKLDIEKNIEYGIFLIKEAANAGVKVAISQLEKIKKQQIMYTEPDIYDLKDDRRKKRKIWFEN